MASGAAEAAVPPPPRARGLSVMEALFVLDEQGRRVEVTSLWKDRRILLTFLRHFGCRFCKQQVRALKVVAERLRASGTSIVLVSLGTPDTIPQFRAEMAVPDDMEVYVDAEPDAPVAYAAFRLHSGRELVLNPQTAELGAVALAEGNADSNYPSADGPYTGNVFQIGGVFILGAGNVCDYAFRSSHAGDHPDPVKLIEAATGITSNGAEFTYPTTTAWLERLGAGAAAAPDRSWLRRRLPSLSPLHGRPLEAATYISATLALVLAAILIASPPPPPLPAPPPPLVDSWIGSLISLLGEPPPPPPPPPLLAAESFGSLATLLAVLGVAGLLATSAAATARRLWSRGSRQLPGAAAVRLLTPEDVDDLALRRQLVTCDCGRVTEGTDMSTASSDFSSHELIGIDTLGTLDSLGGLPMVGAGAPTDPLPDDPSLTNADLHQLRLANCYMREFLSRPHPLLGRSGPTCPFVPKALKIHAMRLAVLHCGASPHPSAMADLVRGFISIFERLEPQSGPSAVFKAVLLLFPDVPLDRASAVIDGTQAALKAEFVERGLMLGEFHLQNNSQGLHNPGFYPLRTICPTLAIRHMVPQDLVFLTGEQYPAAKRVAFLKSFIGRMEGQKGAKAQADVAHARELMRELGAS